MRKNGIILLLTVLSGWQVFAYNDHRGHNLDSLERAVARWTPDAMDKASDTDLVTLNRAYRDLMLGYSALNSEKCVFYARKALSISEPRGWKGWPAAPPHRPDRMDIRKGMWTTHGRPFTEQSAIFTI